MGKLFISALVASKSNRLL